MSENNTKVTTNPGKKHVTIKFIIVMIACMLLGGVGGFMSKLVGDGIGSVYTSLQQWLVVAMPAIQWVWVGLSTLASVLFYLAARTAVFAYERGGSDNEGISTRAERLLAMGMVSSQLCMVVGYGLFGVAAALPYSINAGLLVGVAAVFTIIIFYSAYSTLAVKLLKRLNPEKQGHPLSFKFEQEWLASCDEAERMGIYKAAYASYKATNMALLAVWLVTVIVGLNGNIGIYPIIAVTAVWLVQCISYQVHTIADTGNKKKLER